ncbi:cytochrome b561 and DOMON domain-containing protein-like protein [Tanacetum coccineum]
MIGAQALVAVTSSDGSVQAYTSAITGYATRLQPSSLSFDVPMIRAERVSGDVVMYAMLVLPSGSNNTNAVGDVDFTTGQISADGGNAGGSRLRRKNTHGVLNVVSWGVMMPIGAIAARYLKAFNIANPLWFYIHAVCQTGAFAVGIAGFVTGVMLGSDSTGITHTSHRYIGITLVTLGTVQVLALFLRPKPGSKYRIYWNIYHRGCGYSTLILSIIQVYSGLDILDPEKKWKHTYTSILIALGVVTVLLEVLSWYIFLKRKEDKKTHAGTNGAYGAHEQV